MPKSFSGCEDVTAIWPPVNMNSKQIFPFYSTTQGTVMS